MPSPTSSSPSTPSQLAEVVGTADTEVAKLQEDTIFSNWSDISIPANGTFTGCEVEIVAFSGVELTEAQTALIEVSIDTDNFNGEVFPNSPINQSGTLTSTTFGSSTALWGFELSDWASVNWSTFSVKYKETVNNVFYLDYIRIKIYYRSDTGNQIAFSSGHLSISDGHIII